MLQFSWECSLQVSQSDVCSQRLLKLKLTGLEKNSACHIASIRVSAVFMQTMASVSSLPWKFEDSQRQNLMTRKSGRFAGQHPCTSSSGVRFHDIPSTHTRLLQFLPLSSFVSALLSSALVLRRYSRYDADGHGATLCLAFDFLLNALLGLGFRVDLWCGLLGRDRTVLW